MLRRLVLAVALVLATLGVVPLTPASAAGFTVSSNGDGPDATPGNGICATSGGACTLRAAVQEANALAGSDTITVPAMTISLGSELQVTSNLTVQGAGARQTVLAATGGAHGMLRVTAGTVSLSGMTVTGATGFGALGVYQTGGALTLDGMRFTGISATTAGGGYGPVYTQGGTMLLRDSEVSGNSTTSTSGSGFGGGLSVYDGTVTVINSTIADNSLVGASWAYGGGIWAGQKSSITVRSSTIAGNSVSAPDRRGAAFFQHTGGTGSIEVADSVLASPVGTTHCAGGGVLPSFQDRNLISDTSCGAASPTRTIADAQLGVLADNGGTTGTRVPQAGSPAIDAASACASPADQRGQARPIGAACDLGAAEVGADREIALAWSNTSPVGGSDVVLTATARNRGADRSTGTTVSVSAPAAAQVMSASVPGGSCAVSGSTVNCTLGALASGADANVVMTVRMPSTGSVAATGSIAGQQPDPTSGNNSATSTATVVGSQPGPGVTPTPTPSSSPTVAPVTTCSTVRTGTGRADVLRGTAGSDRITGKGGNDRITGLAGNDCINAGKGNDRISGGPGTDSIIAGPGKDVVKAKDGTKDRIDCGSGRDRVIADRKDKVAGSCEVVKRR